MVSTYSAMISSNNWW